jgi:CRP-like cAMP-binding protein
MIKQMIPFMRKIKFFSQRDIEEQDYILFGNIYRSLLVESMYYEFMPKGTIVFEKDTIGEEFFIILAGEVAVYLKNDQQSTGKLARLIQTNIHELIWV